MSVFRLFVLLLQSIRPSDCPDVLHGVRNPYKGVRDRAEFLGKKFLDHFLSQEWGKWAKIGPKIGPK